MSDSFDLLGMVKDIVRLHDEMMSPPKKPDFGSEYLKALNETTPIAVRSGDAVQFIEAKP